MTKFRVVTFDSRRFGDACLKLKDKVEASGFVPDLVMAIPRGGCHLRLEAWTDFKSAEMSFVKRHGVSIKDLLKPVIKILPTSIRDRLRALDAGRLIRRSGHVSADSVILPELESGVKRVLLLDDAVDSGSTLRSVIDAMKIRYPDIEVKSAVITITSDTPIAMPDYYLYNDSTLIRMPWSIDAR